MRRKQKLPELLAPAGCMSALIAAVECGADAVYVGGKRFGARAFAPNFDDEQMKRAVLYCHIHGVRLYVTVNTLIYDRELEDAVEYCAWLYSIGVDAVIICDLGLVSLLRERVPDLELHASTQMGIHNRAGADFAHSLGITRVVLARECSCDDIKSVIDTSAAECEVFVHGALCVCHSGQCLFSSMLGGRSGNRGECAQPCRLPYDGSYPISLADLSLSTHIPELIRSGVASLKIEGRMKSPEYVRCVVRIFRRLLDEGRGAGRAELRELREAFTRGDFTDGYFTEQKFSKMTGIREDKPQGSEMIRVKDELYPPARAAVRAHVEIRLGEESRLQFELALCDRWCKREMMLSAIARGAAAGAAISSPLTKEGVGARIAKLGDSPYSLSPQDCKVSVDDGINLPPSAINSLRRDAVAALNAMLMRPLSTIFSDAVPTAYSFNYSMENDELPEFLNTAIFYRSDVLYDLYRMSRHSLARFNVIFVGIEDVEVLPDELFMLPLGAYVPPVIMEREYSEVTRLLKIARARGMKYALVSNIGHMELLSGMGFVPIGDFRLNISNRAAMSFYRKYGIKHAIISPELTLPMARDVGGGVIVMGRIPLMLTERCFIKENFGCDRCSDAALRDRYNKQFPLLREFGHRNLIFNSKLTYMGDGADELRKYRICHSHFIFSSESAQMCMTELELYSMGIAPGDKRDRDGLLKDYRRIGRR